MTRRYDGICPECKRRPRAEGRSYCQPCNTKRVHEWSIKNRDKRRAGGRRWAREKKLEIINYYGGKCACCGEHRIEFLTIDHKGGGGNLERRTYKSQTWKIVRKNGKSKKYQILCYNCNNATHHYKICPHKVEATQSSRKSPHK